MISAVPTLCASKQKTDTNPSLATTSSGWSHVEQASSSVLIWLQSDVVTTDLPKSTSCDCKDN